MEGTNCAMSEYYYAVVSRPVAGREKEYNEWYDLQHMPDVLAVPGFVSARRYVAEVKGERQYLAIYEMHVESPDAAIAELSARAGTDLMPMSDALDMTRIDATVYRPWKRDNILR
jgi:hypothetical protein